ncbi:MAG TPA: hypothetical protein DCE44_23745 [Verrucomicrobiales bacterium]|nr:hypothetical protein [Verrucomicrobiales bacterium]
MEQVLGLRAVKADRGFEIDGVDPKLSAEFSKRRHEIESVMAARGWEGAKAAEAVAFETRSTKVQIDREQLFSKWQTVGRALGWSTEELKKLLQVSHRPRDVTRERTDTAQIALHKATEFDSHFARRDLVRALAEEAQGRGIGARGVYQLRDQLFQAGQIVPVGYRNHETRYSTPEMLEIERKFLQAAKTLHEQERAQAHTPHDEIFARYPTLSGEQREVVRWVTESMGGLQLVSGMAGTGKTYAFRVAKEIWEAQGLSVQGTSLSGKAASGLQQGSEVPSMTMHRLLWGLKHGAIPLGPTSVVLVDEAAMVGTRQLLELTARCQQAGAKLVLAGDSGQLQSVEAGGGFAALVREFGATTLTEIQRQREPWAREAVRDFATGRSAQALGAYTDHGLLHPHDTGELAELALVGSWTSRFADPPANLVLSGTNAEVQRLNAFIQRQRQDSGNLVGEPTPLGDERVYVNDRVLFTKNSQAIGVFNGDLGTVVKKEGSTIAVRLDQGRSVTVNTSEYKHLRLGYALTTHKAQGVTTEQAFVLAGRMQNQEMTYVQASRARGDTLIFLGTENLDWMAERMATSQPKELATTLLNEHGPKLELELVR